MFRAIVACVVVASEAARRAEVGVEEHKVNTKAKFGASCEHLQEVFSHRVGQMQSLIDAHPDESSFSTGTSARFMMRSYGIVRTLRRARTCSWVVDGDSAAIEQARAIVQVLVAGNPCAEAARAELAAGNNAETAELEVQAVYRAMSVLTSENCEVADAETSTTVDEAGLDAQLEEEEAMAQDNIDDALEAAEAEDATGGAFVQTDSSARLKSFNGVVRVLGALFLAIFLALACAGGAAVIGFFIAFTISLLTFEYWCVGDCRNGGGILAIVHAYAGAAVAGALGLASCSYMFFNLLLE